MGSPLVPSVRPSGPHPRAPTATLILSVRSVHRDLSVDAGLPHHQYQLQQLPQHYQHYLASPRMHHFPRNTSSAQVVSLFLNQKLNNTLFSLTFFFFLHLPCQYVKDANDLSLLIGCVPTDVGAKKKKMLLILT